MLFRSGEETIRVVVRLRQEEDVGILSTSVDSVFRTAVTKNVRDNQGESRALDTGSDYGDRTSGSRPQSL